VSSSTIKCTSCTRNFTFIAQYRLVPGTDYSVIYTSRSVCFTIEIDLIKKSND